jgi:hypothetical protein
MVEPGDLDPFSARDAPFQDVEGGPEIGRAPTSTYEEAPVQRATRLGDSWRSVSRVGANTLIS